MLRCRSLTRAILISMLKVAKKSIFGYAKRIYVRFVSIAMLMLVAGTSGATRPAALLTLPFMLSKPSRAVAAGPDQTGIPDAPSGEEGGADATIKVPDSIQDVLLDVCRAKDYDIECAKTLLGILWKESRGYSKAIGDRGKARGYFQIHYRLHKITIDCAEDLRCGAEWTLAYLERNGYPKYPTYATQCHNGCKVKNGYAASAIRHGVRLWDEPIPLDKPDDGDLIALNR